MVIENPFKNMKITSYYKYLLVLFGLAFLISLVYEVKGFSSKEIQHLSLWIIGASVVVWILEEGLIKAINNYLFEEYIKTHVPIGSGKKGKLKYDRQAFSLFIIDIIIQIIIWFFILLNILPPYLGICA